MSTAPGRRKDKTQWLYTTHDIATLQDIKDVLGALESLHQKTPQKTPEHLPQLNVQDSRGILWIKQESAILHVACRNLASAERLLDLVRKGGFKRAGIIATTRRIMLEIIGTEAVAIPLGTGKTMKAPMDYLAFALKVCNANMKTNANRIKGLVHELSALGIG